MSDALLTLAASSLPSTASSTSASFPSPLTDGDPVDPVILTPSSSAQSSLSQSTVSPHSSGSSQAGPALQTPIKHDGGVESTRADTSNFVTQDAPDTSATFTLSAHAAVHVALLTLLTPPPHSAAVWAVSVVSSDKKRGKWSAAEDAQLRAAVLAHKGKNWKNIAKAAFGEGKSDVQCLHRWQKVLDPKLVKGPWTKQEDSMVIQLVDKFGPKKCQRHTLHSGDDGRQLTGHAALTRVSPRCAVCAGPVNIHTDKRVGRTGVVDRAAPPVAPSSFACSSTWQSRPQPHMPRLVGIELKLASLPPPRRLTTCATSSNLSAADEHCHCVVRLPAQEYHSRQPAGTNRQAVQRALAQPSQPGHQEGRVDAGGGRHHTAGTQDHGQ